LAVPAVASFTVVDTNLMKDQVLIAQARMTCCEVWLEAFDKRREAVGA